MRKLKERTYTRNAKEAAILLGKYIQLARKERELTLMDLADRAGISRTTLQKIEKGDPKCEVGLYFEVATLVGVPLFSAESSNSFAMNVERLSDKLALLPKKIHKKKKEIDDAF